MISKASAASSESCQTRILQFVSLLFSKNICSNVPLAFEFLRDTKIAGSVNPKV